MPRKQGEVRKKDSQRGNVRVKRRLKHEELIAQLTPEDRDPGNERSVSDALIEERRCGPADLDQFFDEMEQEDQRDLRDSGNIPRFEKQMKSRRLVAGPLNNPLIEAYERLYARLSKELDGAEASNEKMALSQAASALINAIETERLIHSPYDR